MLLGLWQQHVRLVKQESYPLPVPGLTTDVKGPPRQHFVNASVTLRQLSIRPFSDRAYYGMTMSVRVFVRLSGTAVI